ncbi:hypothetical protein [Dasineura jujubifolia toursvirus 2a]|nr:hypothetical protein [Dasineura jujubifolia toursvirus 2a]
MNQGYKNILKKVLILIIIMEGVEMKGFVISPASRSYTCKVGLNKNCGDKSLEPYNINCTVGFPNGGAPDNAIASCNITEFKKLDDVRFWTHVPVVLNHEFKNNIDIASFDIEWKIVESYKSSSFQVFITNELYQINKKLSRNVFDLKPLCEDIVNEWPIFTYTQKCRFNMERIRNIIGKYTVLLAIWNVENPNMAFYQVIDTLLF